MKFKMAAAAILNLLFLSIFVHITAKFRLSTSIGV